MKSIYDKIDSRIKELKNIRNYTLNCTAVINKIHELEVIDARIDELNLLLVNIEFKNQTL